MADHIKQQIREAAVATLTGLATTSNNVHKSRVYPLENGGLPALCIYTTNESAERHNLRGDLERTITLVIDVYARASTGGDDTLDQIQKEVEVAMAAADALGGLDHDSQFTGAEDDPDGEADSEIWKRTITYLVKAHTTEAAPDVPI